MSARRTQIQITPEEIHTFLRQQSTLIIVSNGKDGFPHPMPMHFAVDENDEFWVITYRKSQKVKNFERDPRASLLIEAGIAYAELKGVMIYANATIVDDLTAVKTTMYHVAQKRKETGVEHEAALQSAVEATEAKRVAIKFAPSRYISWDHGKLGGAY